MEESIIEVMAVLVVTLGLLVVAAFVASKPLRRLAARKRVLAAPYDKYAVLPGLKSVPILEIACVDNLFRVGIIYAAPEGFTAEAYPGRNEGWTVTRPTIDEAARALVELREDKLHELQDQARSPEEQARLENVVEILEFKRRIRRT